MQEDEDGEDGNDGEEEEVVDDGLGESERVLAAAGFALVEGDSGW